MIMREVPADAVCVGMIVKSRVYGHQGIVSGVELQKAKGGDYYFTCFQVTWADGKVTRAYHHENAFEIMHIPKGVDDLEESFYDDERDG